MVHDSCQLVHVAESRAGEGMVGRRGGGTMASMSPCASGAFDSGDAPGSHSRDEVLLSEWERNGFP